MYQKVKGKRREEKMVRFWEWSIWDVRGIL